MPHIGHNLLLEQDLALGGMVAFPYPKDKNEASFFGAFNHNLVVNDVFFKSPIDFIIIPKPDKLELHWLHARTLPRGQILYMNLDELGTNYYYDPKTNVTLNHTVPSSLFMVNLRAPIAEDAGFYLPRQKLSPGPQTLINHEPDVPRNVTVFSTANDAALSFRIDGFDCYNRPMTEVIPGPNAGPRYGKKSFAKITTIQASDNSEGEISLGTGNRFGLPVYLPAEGYMLQEMVNGRSPARGMIICGDIGVPGPSTGDRRGTYTPSPTVDLNGRNALYLLLSLPNPGNIGSPDYVGK